MKRKSASDVMGLHLFTGFFTGLSVTILFYTFIFQLLDAPIRFTYLGEIHQDHPMIFLIDILPILGLLAGYFTGRDKIQLLDSDRQLDKSHQYQKAFLISALENLSDGSLNVKMEDEKVDPEIRESMRSLQHRLKENWESEKQTRINEQQRSWTSEGLAMFGDILRGESNDQEKLSYRVISNLVRYLDINQGGLFLVEEMNDQRFLGMVACHAYERNKFPDIRINWGEGLIGAVAIEKKSYYTNKIPDDYLNITSGLGRANPKYLLIVPLLLNEEVFGVFELASFKPFEQYMIQFVERVAENTATTLNIMRSNQRTTQLLEETKEQAEQLAIQEEKVRQNIEELKETQLNAAKQAEQSVNFSNTVNHTLIRAEYNAAGILTYANTLFLRKLGYTANRDVEGKSVTMFIPPSDHDWFNGMWQKLSKGGKHYEGYMRHTSKMGEDLWTLATYTCMRKASGEIDKILFLALDSTDHMQKMNILENQLKAVDNLNCKAEFGPDGRLLHFNEQFEKTLKYNSKDLIGKNVFDFIQQSDQEQFSETWEQVISGHDYKGKAQMAGKFEEVYWFRLSLTPISDMFGEIDKVIFLAADITREKQLEQNQLDQQHRMKNREQELRLENLDLRKEINTLKKTLQEKNENLEKDRDKLIALLEVAPFPAITINNQGLIEIINKAGKKLFKVKARKVTGMSISMIFSDDQKEKRITSFVAPGLPVEDFSRMNVPIVLTDGDKINAIASIYTVHTDVEKLHTMIIHEE